MSKKSSSKNKGLGDLAWRNKAAKLKEFHTFGFSTAKNRRYTSQEKSAIARVEKKLATVLEQVKDGQPVRFVKAPKGKKARKAAKGALGHYATNKGFWVRVPNGRGAKITAPKLDEAGNLVFKVGKQTRVTITLEGANKAEWMANSDAFVRHLLEAYPQTTSVAMATNGVQSAGAVSAAAAYKSFFKFLYSVSQQGQAAKVAELATGLILFADPGQETAFDDANEEGEEDGAEKDEDFDEEDPF